MSSFFFFKQRTAYEMRISDWSSDVCSSDLLPDQPFALRSALSGYPELTEQRGVANSVCTALRRARSEERRVGKECVSTCRSRWSPYPYKKKHSTTSHIQQTSPTTTRMHT